ncbi:sulfite exporter TauE/SafE family protein [Acutalibacter sp. 1XD8-33]|uniref:sulfite exporter TauE/SafE family protein n=1 Tax=Acutalibacter sp. 1XD8-33 TaxID=2320081 RepID=UPI000EA36956|nr:sulfite exporter TauE/SafE family protein [Acutalibacter sp. 1XD8-33]RKJ40575.1 sulfite exporter TauE/SafE family protein [Acutalibacter sp. 1XD8-33]
MEWIWSSGIGFLTGILSGFGIGGGSLLLLWLTAVQGIEQLQAGGTNLLYFISCALPAIWGHIKNGLMETQAVLWCSLGGVPVCIAASLAAAGMDTSLLRRCFGAFILAVGLREVFHRKKKPSEG